MKRSASLLEGASKWLDGEDGQRFVGLKKKSSNNVYRDETVSTPPSPAD